jgi:hypothetical protein
MPCMRFRESLRALLQLPEMCMVGSVQERAAFIALRVDEQTVREAGQAIGVSKSQVTNLAALFQDKLAKRIMDVERKRLPVSQEYLEMRRALLGQLHELQEESGSDDSGIDDTKVGNFSPGSVSREDWAEVRGIPLRDLDE